VAIDVKIKIALVEQERRAFAILHDGQSAFPNETAQLPRAEAEVMGCVFEAEQSLSQRSGRLPGAFMLIWIGHGLVTPLSKQLIPLEIN